VSHNTVINDGIESLDLTGLAEIVFDHVEKLLCYAILSFGSQREAAIPEFLECLQ
jgi:hypothetical protein